MKELKQTKILILGIGNTLMKDEGIGVYIVNRLSKRVLPENVSCLDGGTGSFALLEPMQIADKVIIIDATISNLPAGSIQVLFPKYSEDYPNSLTAHDIGLKDLLDAFYFMGGKRPEIILIAVTIKDFQKLGIGISDELERVVPEIEKKVLSFIPFN